MLCRRQIRDLLAWAREKSCLVPFSDYPSKPDASGQEHRIWPSLNRSRIFKGTYAGSFGFTVVSNEATGGAPELTRSLPLEYLERLLLQNELFGDQVILEAVALDGEQPVIVSSQPTLIGEPVSLEQIQDFMQRLWFQPLRGLSLGNPGALAFYRDLDEIAAFDAHPANFVKDVNGVVLPIDLILVRADQALQIALRPFLA